MVVRAVDQRSVEANGLAGGYDVVIRGGRIVDGTGSPWFIADVGIRAGKIVRIGRIPADIAAGQVIDATGLVVAPGFIDMMGQTASPMLRDPESALNLLSQGVTTINAGEGVSAAPLSGEEAARAGWSTMAEHFALIDSVGVPVNVVQTIGATQARKLVLGDVDRQPSPEELDQMRALVQEAMEAGAIGVSTALIYPPATYASKEEIASLCEVAGHYGGRYYTHIRNEGDELLESLDEALEIGQSAGTPVHIFHLKAAGQQNWGKMSEAIARLKAARVAGHQVAVDIYPYINNGLTITAFIPPKHSAEGNRRLLEKLLDANYRQQVQYDIENEEGWENWYRHIGRDWNKAIVGRTTDQEFASSPGASIQELADRTGRTPWEIFFQLCQADTFVLPQSMSEANLCRAMKEEFVSFCTDVGPKDDTGLSGHPRSFGAFPRVLGRYVRDWGVISLERAVAQASAVAANEVLVYDRGRIAEGLVADVIVFDADKIEDRATFAEPHAVAVGMQAVVVNGVVAFEDGKLTGALPGRVLRGPGYDPTRAAK